MGAFSRSWEITKATLAVMKKDKEIFAFPVLAVIISIIATIIFGVVLFAAGILSFASGASMDIFGWIALFIFYLIMAVISTFFSVCVVYTASVRFKGGNATFGESIGFAFKRFGRIFLWAILSATVGLIFKLLENFGRKLKGAGKVVFSIAMSLLGAAWNIATIFVIQGIVYKDLTPFAAIKDSVLTLKKTWGESLIKYLGMGLIQFIVILIGIIVFIPLIIIGAAVSGWLLIIMLFLFVAYIVAAAIFFNIANDVFNTAIYAYATTGKVPEGFSQEQVREAFKKKEA